MYRVRPGPRHDACGTDPRRLLLHKLLDRRGAPAPIGRNYKDPSRANVDRPPPPNPPPSIRPALSSTHTHTLPTPVKPFFTPHPRSHFIFHRRGSSPPILALCLRLPTAASRLSDRSQALGRNPSLVVNPDQHPRSQAPDAVLFVPPNNEPHRGEQHPTVCLLDHYGRSFLSRPELVSIRLIKSLALRGCPHRRPLPASALHPKPLHRAIARQTGFPAIHRLRPSKSYPFPIRGEAQFSPTPKRSPCLTCPGREEPGRRPTVPLPPSRSSNGRPPHNFRAPYLASTLHLPRHSSPFPSSLSATEHSTSAKVYTFRGSRDLRCCYAGPLPHS